MTARNEYSPKSINYETYSYQYSIADMASYLNRFEGMCLFIWVHSQYHINDGIQQTKIGIFKTNFLHICSKKRYLVPTREIWNYKSMTETYPTYKRIFKMQ
jgi:hypothetical protein